MTTVTEPSRSYGDPRRREGNRIDSATGRHRPARHDPAVYERSEGGVNRGATPPRRTDCRSSSSRHAAKPPRTMPHRSPQSGSFDYIPCGGSTILSPLAPPHHHEIDRSVSPCPASPLVRRPSPIAIAPRASDRG
ncbi:MAG TPA: hypothetical protein DCQ98_13975 [Planctomycetaceae bacterium]|nr:hypothetical protein [Planctomycetaceae bacterium]